MSLDAIRDAIPDFARDLKLNLGSVLTVEGAPGLNEQQIWSVALAAALAARNTAFARQIEQLASARLEDAEYRQLPAQLRMNVLANPGIDKLDFELLSLAVSAVNACGLCITAHEQQLRRHGFAREAIQSAVRITAVVHAVAGILEYRQAA